MAQEHFKQSDGRFYVRAYTEINRHGRPQHRIRSCERGCPPCTQTAPSEQAAVATAQAIWRSYLDGHLLDEVAPDADTLQELVDAFTARPGLSPASVRSYKQALSVLVQYIGADRPVSVIGKTAIEKWLAGMTCKPVSKASYLRSASALFKWAKKQELVKTDPTDGVRVQQARGGHKLRPWLQHREWDAFLAQCGKSLAIRAEFVLHTGLRLSELLSARWDWVHETRQGKTLTVPASKSARARAIPLDLRALELLEDAKARWGSSGLIFTKDPLSQPGNLRRDVHDACVRAKVTVTDFHGLRRSCGARWIEVGIEMFVVSRWLGHADVSTTARHYLGLSDTTSQNALDRVNAAISVPENVVPLRRAAG